MNSFDKKKNVLRQNIKSPIILGNYMIAKKWKPLSDSVTRNSFKNLKPVKKIILCLPVLWDKSKIKLIYECLGYVNRETELCSLNVEAQHQKLLKN